MGSQERSVILPKYFHRISNFRDTIQCDTIMCDTIQYDTIPGVSTRPPRAKNWVLVISMLWNCLRSCASVSDCVCGMVMLSMMIGGILRCCFVVVMLVLVGGVVVGGGGDCCCVSVCGGDVCGGGGGGGGGGVCVCCG